MFSRQRVAAVGVLGALLLITGCSESDSVRDTDKTSSQPQSTDSHTMHTGPTDGIWPPQPQGITNVQPYPASARDGVLTGVLTAARGSITNNPRVRASLGSDYREIDATLGDEKSNVVASLLFYNYATNETITASLQNDGSITTANTVASFFQPMEHPQEQTDAIALARTALTGSGFNIAGLEPTAMLAFPPQINVQSAEAQFYDHRVLYVTFGPGRGALPAYTALVDISDAVVLEHGLVR